MTAPANQDPKINYWRLLGSPRRHPWQGCDLDLTGVTIDCDMSFVGAVFSGGAVSFDHATFSGGAVSFEGATFSDGRVYFEGATLSGGSVSFTGARGSIPPLQ